MKEKNIGLERWSGLLEGLTGFHKGNIELFQSELSYIIPEDNINENTDKDMKTMNNHFIPEISDLRVGYECEVQEIVRALTHDVNGIIRTDLTYDENWKSIIIDKDLSGNLTISHCEHLLEGEHLRTPYLTKEQIEAEGWEETVSHGVFGKKENKVGYLQCVGEPPLIWITINDQEKYHGECKDINTFRWLCKLLKI
jgi:hypothetical protein